MIDFIFLWLLFMVCIGFAGSLILFIAFCIGHIVCKLFDLFDYHG